MCRRKSAAAAAFSELLAGLRPGEFGLENDISVLRKQPQHDYESNDHQRPPRDVPRVVDPQLEEIECVEGVGGRGRKSERDSSRGSVTELGEKRERERLCM